MPRNICLLIYVKSIFDANIILMGKYLPIQICLGEERLKFKPAEGSDKLNGQLSGITCVRSVPDKIYEPDFSQSYLLKIDLCSCELRQIPTRQTYWFLKEVSTVCE